MQTINYRRGVSEHTRTSDCFWLPFSFRGGNPERRTYITVDYNLQLQFSLGLLRCMISIFNEIKFYRNKFGVMICPCLLHGKGQDQDRTYHMLLTDPKVAPSLAYRHYDRNRFNNGTNALSFFLRWLNENHNLCLFCSHVRLRRSAANFANNYDKAAGLWHTCVFCSSNSNRTLHFVACSSTEDLIFVFWFSSKPAMTMVHMRCSHCDTVSISLITHILSPLGKSKTKRDDNTNIFRVICRLYCSLVILLWLFFL